MLVWTVSMECWFHHVVRFSIRRMGKRCGGFENNQRKRTSGDFAFRNMTLCVVWIRKKWNFYHRE